MTQRQQPNMAPETKQRYLTAAAINTALAEEKPVQWKYIESQNWNDYEGDSPAVCSQYLEWRIKPTPTVRNWTAKDVPPVCWLTAGDWRFWLVILIEGDGVWTANGAGNQKWSWSRMANTDVKHSTDRQNWQPCTTTEP